MGLLDTLFPGSDGGLLDFLKGNAAFQRPADTGLPSDQAQYAGQPQFAPAMNAQAQMPPQGVPQNPPSVIPAQPMPQQPMAQPAQQPIAPPQQAGSPGFMTGYENFRHGGGLIGSLLAGATGQRNDPYGQAQQQQAQVANVTFNALKARGVDPQVAAAAVQPGNGEMLKALITQTMGPQTLTSLGNGYVADRNGNVRRAYEPEDKIPAGYERTSDGKGLQFIKGGPEDPATQLRLKKEGVDPTAPKVLGRGGEVYHVGPDGKIIIDHKNQADMEPMDPASLEILARREIGGDFSGRKNLGRGAQGAADLKAITNKSSEILTSEMGMTPTEAAAHLLKKQQEYDAQGQGLRAEARTTGVREANLNLILKAADAAIPAALEASDKVARTGWVPVNKIIQGGQVMASDPNLKKFGMANLQLAEHWARAMNPTGVMRESDRDKALSFLSTADSQQTYKEAVGQLRTQIERERDAVRSTRGMATMPGVVEPTTSPQGTPAPGAYVWSPSGGVQPK